jgi:hypothetical protein
LFSAVQITCGESEWLLQQGSKKGGEYVSREF